MPGAYRSQSANSHRLLDLNLNLISFGRKSEQAHSCAGYRPHTLRTYWAQHSCSRLLHLLFLFILFYVCECFSVCMFVYHVCAWFPWGLEEAVGCPRTGLTDFHEPLCSCWELNLCPLQEQHAPLAIEPSLQPHHRYFEPSHYFVRSTWCLIWFIN